MARCAPLSATAMLFKPLAYASTLDRCGIHCYRRVIVEAFWSPALALALINTQAKVAVDWTASITAPKRARTFLSQAEPRFRATFSSS